MMRVEQVTAKRLAQRGIGPGDLAATLRKIQRMPFSTRRRTEIRRLEEAVGGMVQIAGPGAAPSSLDTSVHPDLDRGLVFASVRLDDVSAWEADSLCRPREGLPETLLQGVHGLRLGQVIEDDDLPDGIIDMDKPSRPSEALLSIDRVDGETLPEPTRRDRAAQRRAVRRFVRDERIAMIDEAVRRLWARNGLLLLGTIAVLWWLATLIGRHGQTMGGLQIVSGTVVTAMPILTAWNILEGNPLMHRWINLPAIESRHRQETESEHRNRIGTRPRLDWVPDQTASVL